MDTSDMTVKDDSTSSKIKGRRPGRPSSNISPKQRQERSRQSARDCRNRKNIRYQYLEQLVNIKEKSVYKLRKELEEHRRWCEEIDNGVISEDLVKGFSIDQQKALQLQTAEQSDIPLPRQRSLSLPIESALQTSNSGLTSAQGISKSTKDSKLYKLLTGRISFTQLHSLKDTANVLHSNRTQSLSSEDTSSVRNSFPTQSLYAEDTSNVRHSYTAQSNYRVDSYSLFHQHSETHNKEDTSTVYTQQPNGSISGKLSSTRASSENQQAVTLSSFSKFDTKSQDQVATSNNYKLGMHEQPNCISHFDNLSVLSKGNNTNLASFDSNQSSDECNIPKTYSDINILNEASHADDSSSEMKLVDWILKNKSKIFSDRALIESSRQFEDTTMLDIFTENQTDITDVSSAQFDMLHSEDNYIDTSNNPNVTYAKKVKGNIKIFDIQAPTTVASTLNYRSTLPSMLNCPAYSSSTFQRSTSTDFIQTTNSSMDTFVSQSHHSSGPFNPIDLPVTESKSNDTRNLQDHEDVSIHFNQLGTSENLKELRRQNVSLTNQKPVVIASAGTSREILSTSNNSGYARENKGEAVHSNLYHSLSEEIRHDTEAILKRSHSAGDTPHPNVQNKFPFLSFLLNIDDEN